MKGILVHLYYALLAGFSIGAGAAAFADMVPAIDASPLYVLAAATAYVGVMYLLSVVVWRVLR